MKSISSHRHRPGGRRRSEPRPERGVNLEKVPHLQLVAFQRKPRLVEFPKQNQRAISAEIPAIPGMRLLMIILEAVEAVK
jgi:hypothetical protein